MDSILILRRLDTLASSLASRALCSAMPSACNWRAMHQVAGGNRLHSQLLGIVLRQASLRYWWWGTAEEAGHTAGGKEKAAWIDS